MSEEAKKDEKALQVSENYTPKKAGPGAPTKYTEDKGEKLIEAMKQGFSYEAASAMLGVSKKTLYNWEKKYPEFLEAKEEGFRQSQIFWERIGLEGIYMGGKDAPFQPSMWIFNMKNRFKWTDRVEQKVEQTTTLEHLVNSTFKDDKE